MKEFAGIYFASLYAVWFIVPLCIFVSLIVVRRVMRTHKALQALRSSSARFLLQGTSSGRLVIKALLCVLGFIFLTSTFLRPQTYKKDQVIKQEGRDLLIAVDVSRSMLAQDCEPNRLAVTKQKIRTLVNQLSSDRVGLVLFSGSACVQCPLTSDYAAFFMFLDALDVETISSGSTALDQAIRQSLEVFKQVPSRKNKLLVLFTDGEDFSTNLSGIKQEAQQERLTIFTLGVGTMQGAPIPLFDEKGKQIGHQKDKKGSVVISRLNEVMLQELAQETGGFYVRVTCENDKDIATLVQKVTSYEKEHFEDKKLAQREEQYHWLLMVSFICFALEWIL
jgi:Ca-activated chloride channel family protein